MKFENDSASYLNNILAINPSAVAEARKCDANKSDDDHPLYGMPVLLKDNINFAGLPTTAGTYLLRGNDAADAFIVDRIQDKGGIILGKTSLSEWANFLCLGCPNGYNAVGGQTLNPYGRKIFDTGGSSSGSGSAIAANYAVAAIGTETSGSILSPSSQSSLVGLKPTTGRLSRSGIVPLSSTLDTPGPMTRTVIDNAIMMNALQGVDKEDMASAKLNPAQKDYVKNLDIDSPTTILKEIKLGYYKEYMDDTLYLTAVEDLKKNGAKLVEIERPEINLPQFIRVLNLDMQKDLPDYITKYGSPELTVRNMQEIATFNKQDSIISMPYGQKLFYGVLKDSASAGEFTAIKDTLLPFRKPIVISRDGRPTGTKFQTDHERFLAEVCRYWLVC